MLAYLGQQLSPQAGRRQYPEHSSGGADPALARLARPHSAGRAPQLWKGLLLLPSIVLAFSLSTDAFAASVAKGARFPSLPTSRVVLIALSFGILEAFAPLLGYILGRQFAGLIEDYDHWIAFGILALLGFRMIWKSLNDEPSEVNGTVPTVGAVFATALGTSVDATAVGITLALFSDNIPLTLLAIGFVTFAMTLIGLRLGGLIGDRIFAITSDPEV